MGAQPVAKLTVEEYLAAERVAEFPSEYHDGEVFVMEATSYAHGILSGNFVHGLKTRLKGQPCGVSVTPHVRLTPRHYVIPDITVVCGEPAFATDQPGTLANPRVVIEVLSPATEGYDSGAKFRLYRMLPSLEEYVLVSQDRPLVEAYRKAPDGGWLFRDWQGLEATARIESLDVALPLAELYEGINVDR